ncbi:PqiC family protein [Halotalea alkalilenta]|uniref:ABC-type transport auxiliary lipoprotein component domain-containing protein n=1 Tax=Halotalea alkalilenta TaxID=376489 RepID=A0A172YB66_9GAMM|nr:ABC-type transport auxiliary lipoprotein family protein [Halotalea alkalilenta]ANF56457.1 hypothetical protein A5892_02395 [Halotalea alkalilenta]
MTAPLSAHSLRACAGMALLTVLAGCGGDATTLRYYSLPEYSAPPPAPSAVLPPRAEPQSLSVAPVVLSTYLRGSGIVYQLSAVEYSQAQANLWAGDLSEQLTRSLREQLANRLPGHQLLPANASGQAEQRLEVELDQFQGRYDGEAVIQGSYQLYDDQQRLLVERPLALTVPLADDGYPALVEALGTGWKSAGEQIANTIMRQSAPNSPVTREIEPRMEYPPQQPPVRQAPGSQD